jgi:hypothetical protein
VIEDPLHARKIFLVNGSPTRRVHVGCSPVRPVRSATRLKY